jgi:hypothetical protein
MKRRSQLSPAQLLSVTIVLWEGGKWRAREHYRDRHGDFFRHRPLREYERPRRPRVPLGG